MASTFSITFYTAQLLKGIFHALEGLTTDVIFDLTDEGINVNTMDLSHVALINIHIPKDDCYVYECMRPIPLGFNVAETSKAFKIASKAEQWSLTVSGKANAGIAEECMFVFSNKEGHVYNPIIKLLDIDAEALVPEVLPTFSMFRMPASLFKSVIASMKTADAVQITIESDMIVFKGKYSSDEMVRSECSIATTQKSHELHKQQYTQIRKRRKMIDKGEELSEEDKRFLSYNARHYIKISGDVNDGDNDAAAAASASAKTNKKKNKDGQIVSCIFKKQDGYLELPRKYLEYFCEACSLVDTVIFYNKGNDAPATIVFPFSAHVIGNKVDPKDLLACKVAPEAVLTGKKRKRDSNEGEDSVEEEEEEEEEEAEEVSDNYGGIVYYVAPKFNEDEVPDK